MELFKRFTDVIKEEYRITRVLRDEWIIRMMTLQYVIGINKRDESGNTILHEICDEGHDNLLEEYLYLPGIDINTKNNLGSTALMKAVACGTVRGESARRKEKCVEILCKTNGIDINAKEDEGWTALM